ncbi:hypothetical protein MKW94_016940 [Papaver nudicaule]|uniref:NB-ARC domain-containing protein n=1 Tax=Papaver nudicaule TaxID=74823 RepID=A0AA41VPZ6_PAPNU|nr:hypothetical protein [Papaver nudicaule]
MEKTLIEPVVEVAVKTVYGTVVRQFSYCINYKKIVEEFARKAKDLSDMRKDLQNRVTAATKNLDQIKKAVETWFERVEKEIEQDEMMVGLMSFINGEDTEIGWGSCRKRHKIGREALKKIVIIDEFLKEGKDFAEVSNSFSPLVNEIIRKSTSTEDSVAFASREYTKNQVMAALKDEEIFSVGIYGMGGIGKTMMKNQVHRQVIEEKLFEKLNFHRLKEVGDKKARAALLKERLMQERNMLVIFDDLWTKDLDLYTDVVKVLSEEDSWDLFKKNVGDVVNSHVLKPVAINVVKECGNLPLALVTLGRALRNKDKSEWDYTAKELRNSNFTDIEGMQSKVLSSIKLSYDYLGNDILKRCFLLCCLFPEDNQIDAEDLLIYAMGDNVIRGDLESIMDVQARLNKALNKLAGLGLLLREKKQYGHAPYTTMHDIVRDVAISIASGQESNKFYVKAGLGLRNWPTSGLSIAGKCLQLSLMDNHITVLPEQPNLPHLLSLSLRANFSLKSIPDSFFESTSALLSLDISGTSISSLPSSLSCLVNLRSLDMGYCKCGKREDISISILGELKKLEILSLAGWGLKSKLPEEIGGLSQLKSLDISDNPRLTIPPYVISRLSCLENLKMDNSFKWKVVATMSGNSSNANLNEVASLNSLINVELDALQLTSGSLSMFKGSRMAKRNPDLPDISHIISYTTQCSSVSIMLLPLQTSVKKLLAKAESLKLELCDNFKSLGQLVSGSDVLRFNNLKHLEVERCYQMEYIISAVEGNIPEGAFPALQALDLYSLMNVKEIFRGPGTGEQIEVRGSARLKEGLLPEERKLVRKEKKEHATTVLPQLQLLSLRDLGITALWRGKFSPTQSLRNLKEMIVIRCHKLRYLFAPTIVIALQQLEILRIDRCNDLVKIVASEDDAMLPVDNPYTISLTSHTLFPNLKNLEIQRCDNLRVLHPPLSKLSCGGGFSRLLRLVLSNCWSLEEILPLDMSEKENDSKKGGEDRVKKMEKMPLPDQIEQSYLYNLPSLKTIWQGTTQIRTFQNAIIDTADTTMDHQQKPITLFGSLENLRSISIRECESLKKILPKRLLLQGCLSKLEHIAVGYCPNIEVIFYAEADDIDHGNKTVPLAAVEVLLGIRKLRLIELPNFARFHHYGRSKLIFGWPSLVHLEVRRCENLRRLPLTHQKIPHKLNKVWGDSEEVFEKWMKLEDECMQSSLRPLFEVHNGGARPFSATDWKLDTGATEMNRGMCDPLVGLGCPDCKLRRSLQIMVASFSFLSWMYRTCI